MLYPLDDYKFSDCSVPNALRPGVPASMDCVPLLDGRMFITGGTLPAENVDTGIS